MTGSTVEHRKISAVIIIHGDGTAGSNPPSCRPLPCPHTYNSYPSSVRDTLHFERYSLNQERNEQVRIPAGCTAAASTTRL
ncbi:MAG: hypothetical protein DRN57_04095 [Thermoplasmata archaeon]|nr:MAG: hypothetical protein DRN57_04095 [Thermoplasmata archaeon]